MCVSDVVNIILSILSFILAAFSLFFVVITIRQNNKMLSQNSDMIENSTRPYVVVYNDLVNGGGTPIQFLVIKNFGQTAAIINRLEITPKIHVRYSDEMFKYMENQVIAPGQSYSTAFKLDDSSIVLNADITYTSGNKTYSESYSISQKAISDNVHSKVKAENQEHAQKIIAGCFQDYLRSRL